MNQLLKKNCLIKLSRKESIIQSPEHNNFFDYLFIVLLKSIDLQQYKSNANERRCLAKKKGIFKKELNYFTVDIGLILSQMIRTDKTSLILFIMKLKLKKIYIVL